MTESVSEQHFDEFVRLHSMGLLRTAYLLTADLHSAEDLLQATFSDLYRKWSKVAQADLPLAYVRRSMINRFHSQRRKRSSSEISVWDVPDARREADISDQVVARQDVIMLLDALPLRQRSAVVLRYFHDLDDDQIAAELDCRPATVRSLLSRAIKAMSAARERQMVTTER